MRPRAQTLGFAGSLLFRIGAAPPMPLAPWHPAHPFERYTRAPSLALPFPGGSSPPVGPIEMSRTRISSAFGVRPMPYVGPCANTGTLISNENAIGRTLREAIGHPPVLRDPPWLHRVVQPRHAECLIEGLVPVLGDLLARRLRLADLVDAARHDLGLVAVPLPRVGEQAKGHPLRRSLELRLVPFLAAVGGDLYLLDGAAAGPGQATDFIEALARQPLFTGRERDDRLRTDLVGERRFVLILVEMAKVVVVHVVLVHQLDALQPLGVEDPFEARHHQAQGESVLWPHRLAVHAIGDEPLGAAFHAALLEQRGQQYARPFRVARHTVRFLHGPGTPRRSVAGAL